MYKIVHADPKLHAGKIHACLKNLMREQGAKDEPKLSEEQIKSYVDAGKFRAVVALDGKESVIGCLIFYQAFSCWKWEGPFLFLESFYVAPEHRRGYLGIELWREVAKVAHGAKMCCESIAYAWNKPSVGIQKKVGFIDVTERDSLHHLSADRATIQRWAQAMDAGEKHYSKL